MIVYGKNVFEQIAQRPDEIQELYVLNTMNDGKVLAQLKTLDSRKIKKVTRNQLDALTNKAVHNGIAAKVKNIPTVSLEEIMDHQIQEYGLIVMLDGIQDPHNIGAILRTCDAAGVNGLVLPKHESAGLSPAAIKTSVGAAYNVPVCITPNLSNAVKKLKENGYWIVGTGLENSLPYTDSIYDRNICLIIGNEGKGMSEKLKKQCDYMIHLPMLGSVESLNASVAAAIVLYEIDRQRNTFSA